MNLQLGKVRSKQGYSLFVVLVWCYIEKFCKIGVCELKGNNPVAWEHFIIQMKENNSKSKILLRQME